MLRRQALAATHLSRIRVGARQVAPGVPEPFTVDLERLVDTCVASVPATVGAQPSS